MGADELLPGNSTGWERAVAGVLDTTATLGPAITIIRGTKITAPPPSFLPFLIYEYGLGELTPYVPNLYDLIAEGIDWQRVRGTPAAIALALSWLGYSARIEEESTWRRFWNMFQLELDRVRDGRSDLDRIAGVAKLSVPLRSVFWRGYQGLDIRPLTYGQSHYSNAHYGEYSGVRLRPGGALWSFGRSHAFSVSPAQADLETLGVYLAPTGDVDLDWGELTWEDTEASWVSSAVTARAQAMAAGVIGRSVWFEFRDADDQVIGYRRARCARYVVQDTAGPYELAGVTYAPQTSVATDIYCECQTGFGEGDGKFAASFGLVFDAHPANPAKPGLMWVEAGELAGGTAPVAVQPITIAFGESIRERVKVLLRF